MHAGNPTQLCQSLAALTCGVCEIPEQKSTNYIMEFFHHKCLMKFGLAPFLLCIGFGKCIHIFVASVLLRVNVKFCCPIALLLWAHATESLVLPTGEYF